MSNQISNNNRAYYDMEQKERKKQKNNIINPYYNNPQNNDINNFQNDTLLQKTKNSVTNLIKFNDKFQNTSQYPGEQIDEIKIKQLLLPVYDKIYEIREDLNKFNELNKKNNNKNISNTEFNDMHHLHTNIVFNKNLIDDTINYMKEKIENVHYEQINKEFQEITSILETLNIEMENMVNDFNNKYEKIIKEKKRQKIAEDLLNGNYNKNPQSNKYDLLNKNDDLKIHKNIDDEDNIDYNKYKYDFNDMNLEKENLMLKYLEDKQKAINGLPKLVAPNEKVTFNYEIKPPNYDNINNANNKNNINDDNNVNNDENNKINDDNNIINNNNNNNDINNIKDSNNSNNRNNIEKNNINNNKQHKENGNNKNNNNYNGLNKQKINGSSEKIKKSKKSVNYMEDDLKYDNNPKKSNGDLVGTMNDFQKKMNKISNQILIGQPRKNFKPKIINTGPTQSDYLRNIQPRSNASKVTYQNFNVQKRPQPYILDNKYQRKPNNFRTGKYPNEEEEQKLNEFIEQNPQRPIPKLKEKNIIEPNSLDKQIQKIVEINVKKALASYGLDSQRRNMNNTSYNNNNNNNDELLKILIQKFDDIENAIRETKNDKNGIQYEQDINEMLANEIFHKIYTQIHSNINVNINEPIFEQPPKPKPQEIKKDDKKEKEEEDDIKQINVFEDNNNVGMNDLDKMIPQPRDLNLRNYDEISDTSSCVNESLRNNKNEINPCPYNIEINKINIREDKLFYENNVNKNNNDERMDNNVDNSISKGEVRSESEEDFPSEYNKRKFYKTDNNYFNKNKTGNDLLMLKYINENLPDNFNYNNYNKDDSDNDNDNEPYVPNINMNNNINYNNNKPEVSMNNNDLLRQYKLYESDEYNKFKNNFQEKMNNNKTQSNFGNINPNYNSSTYTQFRPIQNNQILSNTMGSLKLNKISNKDVEELNQKLQQLKMKDTQKSKELGLPPNDNININQNYLDMNIINNIKKNYDYMKNSGEYSSGEVRSEDSY